MPLTPLAIGLTGGIGSGKSEAARIFGATGALVLHADTIAKELIDSDICLQRRIRMAFGDDVFRADGILDRNKLARIVFSNPLMKENLDAIVHPSVLHTIERRIEAFKKERSTEILVVEAALLYEVHAEKLFDYMVVVDAQETLRIDRVMKRDNTGRIDVVQRIKSQLSPLDKVKRADFVINNSGDIETFRQQCTFIVSLLTKIAHSPTHHAIAPGSAN